MLMVLGGAFLDSPGSRRPGRLRHDLLRRLLRPAARGAAPARPAPPPARRRRSAGRAGRDGGATVTLMAGAISLVGWLMMDSVNVLRCHAPTMDHQSDEDWRRGSTPTACSASSPPSTPQSGCMGRASWWPSMTSTLSHRCAASSCRDGTSPGRGAGRWRRHARRFAVAAQLAAIHSPSAATGSCPTWRRSSPVHAHLHVAWSRGASPWPPGGPDRPWRAMTMAHASRPHWPRALACPRPAQPFQPKFVPLPTPLQSWGLDLRHHHRLRRRAVSASGHRLAVAIAAVPARPAAGACSTPHVVLQRPGRPGRWLHRRQRLGSGRG